MMLEFGAEVSKYGLNTWAHSGHLTVTKRGLQQYEHVARGEEWFEAEYVLPYVWTNLYLKDAYISKLFA